MLGIFSGKTLVPISVIIAIIPAVLWFMDLKSKCSALENDVADLREDRAYIRQKIDDINDNLTTIKISLGVIENEIKYKKTR